MQPIVFEVVGRPATQGSKKVVPMYQNGQPVVKIRADGKPFVVTRAVEDNPRTAEWRQEVAHAAKQAYSGALLDGALILTLHFFRPRPNAHYHQKKGELGELRDDAPKYPTSKPDNAKMMRAVEDSLTGVLWVDDARIVDHHVFKRWGSYFRVLVIVESLED
jgi:Holliday junction resolvase RusA-like endonuclease